MNQISIKKFVFLSAALFLTSYYLFKTPKNKYIKKINNYYKKN
uniref:Uncharacterized protein n=1 Tax=viral metagenome TaxID=1070528 RepID=A0A6C0AE29_9ZZZZ